MQGTIEQYARWWMKKSRAKARKRQSPRKRREAAVKVGPAPACRCLCARCEIGEHCYRSGCGFAVFT